MTTPDDLKTCLLGEIKQEEWRKRLDDQEYKSNSDLIKEICKQNLEAVSKTNTSFKHSKFVKQAPVSKKVSGAARAAYSKWKRENVRKRQCPEVSVQNLLLLVHYLNAQPEKRSKKEISDCLKRQNSDFEVFWDSPSYILQALRKCVVTRDWSNMTHFLLVLLNYDKKYLHVIKNMCQIMVKFNPLVKECGLEDQFLAFLQKSEQNLEIV